MVIASFRNGLCPYHSGGKLSPNPDIPLPLQAPLPMTVPQQPHDEFFLLPPDRLCQAVQLVLAHGRGNALASTSSTAATLQGSLLDGGLVSVSVDSSECGYNSS